MNGIILPGEMIEAECDNCGSFVTATYNYGKLALRSGLTVDKVMRAVCDVCGEVLEVAHQSAHRIQEAKRKSYVKKNFRLPQPLKDYAEVKALEINGEARGAVEFLVRAGLRASLRSPQTHKTLLDRLSNLHDPILSLPGDSPETIHLPHDLSGEVANLQRELHGISQSDVFRRLLVASEQEPTIQKEMKSAARV